MGETIAASPGVTTLLAAGEGGGGWEGRPTTGPGGGGRGDAANLQTS